MVGTLFSLPQSYKLIIISTILCITAISWYYMFYLDAEMQSMNMAAGHICDHECCKIPGMPMTGKWSAIDFTLMFIMWTVMMVAMMFPSVTPLILLFASVNQKRQQLHKSLASPFYFALGYFIVWTGFSLLATMVQWILQSFVLLSPMMITTNKWIGGSILIAAGLFQFSRLKYKCLAHCRNPLDFILHYWRDGKKGALIMGIQNGWYCLGCCWVLMLVLFVTGIMNLYWVAALALLVLIEKLIPAYHLLFSRIVGFIFILYGISFFIL